MDGAEGGPREDRGAFRLLECLGARGFVRGVCAPFLERFQRLRTALSEDEVRGEEVESVDELLGHHARDGDHGNASVVEFLELHVV